MTDELFAPVSFEPVAHIVNRGDCQKKNSRHGRLIGYGVHLFLRRLVRKGKKLLAINNEDFEDLGAPAEGQG